MKLPGEAWLEFKIVKDSIFQTATFRPKGYGKSLLVLIKPISLFYFQRNAKTLSVKKSSLVNGDKF